MTSEGYAGGVAVAQSLPFQSGASMNAEAPDIEAYIEVLGMTP